MNVEYQNGKLVICLPEECPEAAHEGLMRGIVQSIQHQMANSQDPLDHKVKEANWHMLKLLDTLIPDEKHLVKGQQLL